MILRHPINVEGVLMDRHFRRFDEYAADLEDEAAEASVAGNPRRGFYLEQMARTVRGIGERVAWEVYHQRFRLPL